MIARAGETAEADVARTVRIESKVPTRCGVESSRWA